MGLFYAQREKGIGAADTTLLCVSVRSVDPVYKEEKC